MTESKPSKANSQSQSDKFKAMAKDVEADENEKSFDDKLKKIAKAKAPDKFKAIK